MNQAQASDLNPRMTERPASSILELELKQGIKKNGLVIWLDSDDKYSAFVDRLSQKAERGDFPFPVLRYDGSFLELMLALENYGNGLHPEKLLVHMP